MGITLANNTKPKDIRTTVTVKAKSSQTNVKLTKLEKSEIDSKRASYDVFVMV
jgi:hypothetical protein